MGQFTGTFQRYEEKYVINELNYRKLCQYLRDDMSVDQYGETTICNIYFDTPNHLLIRNSMDKPIYKEKLRLRSYGTPTEDDTVFVEIKKKYKGVVYKRRIKKELTEAEQYLYYRKPMDQSTQITKEIDWFLDYYKELVPMMYISYDRIAMTGVATSELRITFDRNILWRDTDLWLEYGSWGNALLKEGELLMEIKLPGVMPIWLSHVLDELKIYPISFSKYAKSYEQSLLLPKHEIKKGEPLYA